RVLKRRNATVFVLRAIWSTASELAHFRPNMPELKAIKPRIARFAASFTQNISWGGLQKLHFADWPHVFFRSFPQPFVILATYGTVFSLSRGLLVYPKPQQSSKAKHSGPGAVGFAFYW